MHEFSVLYMAAIFVFIFLFSYRGYDCRNNLYYTKKGTVVYHVAALGIVYDRNTHKQTFYSAHTDDILCLAMHPTQDYIATGQIGRDPSIHIWDASSMESLSVLQGQHYRGVCSVAFSGKPDRESGGGEADRESRGRGESKSR